MNPIRHEQFSAEGANISSRDKTTAPLNSGKGRYWQESST